MSRPIAALGAAALASAVLVASGPPAPAVPPADDTARTAGVSLRGHGYGHGRGLSQYGAQGAALRGKSYRQILAFYYPHTTMGQATGKIRVLITADRGNRVVVRDRPGLRVRDLADGRVFDLPRRSDVDRWRIKPARGDRSVSVVQYHGADGWKRWRVPGRGPLRGAGQFEAPGPIRLVLPGGSTARYRGALRAAYPAPGSRERDTVNVLPLDAYVRGVIADEMPASWRQAALRAQAVAARTYAAFIRRENRGEHYHICDTTACQVYGGVAAETPSTDRAVAKTAGQIRRHQGRPAFTQFSASSGGWTVAGGRPYLPAQRDPYDDWSGNSVHTWSTRLSASRLESAYPQIGRFQRLQILRRDGNGHWGGRVLRLRIVGSAGSVRDTGEDFRFRLGLRSSWFKIRYADRDGVTTADQYAEFGSREARGVSPSYERLALAVARDDELLTRIETLPPAKRQPNLLFGAVRLLGGPVEDPAAFRGFALANWAAIAAEMRTRVTQTNEAGRCAALLPVLARLRQPLALIEVGASAGLCLYPDRYAYRYGEHAVGEGEPVLACAATGFTPPSRRPEVVWRAGLDLNPLDVTDPADVAWLEALIWPEHAHRRARLRAAAAVAKAEPPLLVRGDLVDDLPALAARAPADATLVVFHTAVLYLVSPARRQAFAEVVRGLPGHWIANESPGVLPYDGLPAPPDDTSYHVVALDGRPLAWAKPHGQRLVWFGPGTRS